MNREIKLTTLADAKVKTTKQGEIDVTGYAAVFGNVDSSGDLIQPGAFRRTLIEQGPSRVTLRGHDVNEVVAVGTFVEDAYGLLGKYRFVPGVQVSDETLSLIKAGAISGISIGYSIVPGGAAFKSGNRVLSDLDLFETSFVTFPMNHLARVLDSDEKALQVINDTLRTLTTKTAIELAFASGLQNLMRKG